MTILVTGASGFIGKHLIPALLSNGFHVIALVRNGSLASFPPAVVTVKGDLNDKAGLVNSLKLHRIDACVHLAWEGIPDFSYDICMNNFRCGITMLELCGELGIQIFLCSGSCMEYASHSGQLQESAALGGATYFQAAKNALHQFAEAFCQEKGICLYWLRLFYVFGEGQREGSLLPSIVREISARRQPVLGAPGNANDFIYVGDVVRAIVQALRMPTLGGVYNIGTGIATPVIEIVKWVAEFKRFSLDLSKYVPTDTPIQFWADTRKALEKLRFEADKDIKKRIERLVKI